MGSHSEGNRRACSPQSDALPGDAVAARSIFRHLRQPWPLRPAAGRVEGNLGPDLMGVSYR